MQNIGKGTSALACSVNLLLFLSACSGSGAPGDSLRGDTGSPGSQSNTPPKISGTPDAIAEIGEGYYFKPAVSDSDGDHLSFSIKRKPHWATFNSSTGELSGRPRASHQARYDRVEILVSDGTTTVALPAFAITVGTVVHGSLTVSWIPPSSNTDSTPLLDLAGFNLYYGRESNRREHTVVIDNPGATSYTFRKIAPGTYYLATTAYNSVGVESSFSNEIVVTVQ
jgi:hypothetical protein